MNGHEELTVGPAAKVIGTSAATVRRMVDRRELIARTTLGGRRIIPRAAAEAMKVRLENLGDPLGLGVASNDDRPPTGNVEPCKAPVEPTEAAPAGLTRGEMRQVALDSMALVLPPLGYLWAPRAYGGQRVFTWTAVMAEHARQRILAWFEANYREGLTWQEVHELALELLKSYARKRASRGTA